MFYLFYILGSSGTAWDVILEFFRVPEAPFSWFGRVLGIRWDYIEYLLYLAALEGNGSLPGPRTSSTTGLLDCRLQDCRTGTRLQDCRTAGLRLDCMTAKIFFTAWWPGGGWRIYLYIYIIYIYI